MLSTLDRLLIREVLKTLAVILLVLLMLILSNALVALLREVAAGEVGLEVVSLLLGVKVIWLLGFITPPAFFFAILWVVGQMHRSSEVVALNAAGVGLTRLYRPLSVVGLGVGLAVGAISLQLYPLAQGYASEQVQRSQSGFRIGGIKAGGFSEFHDGAFTVYAGDEDENGYLTDLFVQYQDIKGRRLVLARRAHVEQRKEGRFLVLENGYRYDGEPGVEGFVAGRFATYGIRLPESKGGYHPTKVEMLPLSTLLAGKSLEFRVELQWRIGAPLSVFALMLAALPLSRSLPRQSVYGRLLVAVVFYMAYVNLIRLAVVWMREQLSPQWLGIWWVPFSAALLALLLFWLDSLKVVRYRRGLLSRWV